MLKLRGHGLFKFSAFLLLAALAFLSLHGFAHIEDAAGGHEGTDCSICRLAQAFLVLIILAFTFRVSSLRKRIPLSHEKFFYLAFAPSSHLSRAPPFFV